MIGSAYDMGWRAHYLNQAAWHYMVTDGIICPDPLVFDCHILYEGISCVYFTYH